MAAWLVRNRLVDGTFTGPRGIGAISLPAMLNGAGEVLLSWTAFDLPLVERQAPALPGFLPAVALAAACAMLVRERRRTRWRTGAPSGWLPCWVFGSFALTYFTGVIASVVVGATYHGVQPRFLTPLYVPLLLTAAVALDRVLGFAPRRRFWRRWKPRWRRGAPRAAAVVATAALSFWTGGQIEPNVREIRRANTEGMAGYSHSFWVQSATVEWIRRNPLAGLVFSNQALVVSIYNYSGAASYGYGYLPGAEGLEELLQRWRAYGVTFYVVWFDDEYFRRHHGYGIAALRASPDLELVAELADGAVFKAVALPDTE